MFIMLLNDNWSSFLHEELNSADFINLQNNIINEYKTKNTNTKNVFGTNG